MTSDSIDDIDLFDPEVQEDWFPAYRRLRDEAPVFRVPGTQMYVVTLCADVLHVLRHQDVFPTGTSVYRSAAARAVYETKGWARTTPLSVNPPEHRHYRALVAGFFDAAGSQRWLADIERVIDELLSGVARLGDLRLAGGNDFSHQPGFVLRALKALHVEWTPSGPSSERARGTGST